MALKTSSGTAFERAGYSRANKPVSRRLIIALDGAEKSGKDHFALTGPEPIAIISNDTGLEGVVQKFQDDKEIWVIEVDVNMEELKGLPEKDAAGEAGKALESRIIKPYREALGLARTIIWDTATEVWELMRMAEFGKIDHIKPHHYARVNGQYRGLVRETFDQDVSSLILLHKIKDEYANDKRTGHKLRSGFSETGFLVQANMLCWRDPAEPRVPECFHLTINDCRQNAELSGIDFSGHDLNFPAVASAILTDTHEEDWI